MSDLYSEWIVKKKSPSWAFAAKAALIILSVILIVLSLTVVLWFLLIPGALLAYLTYRLSMNWDMEYEYTFVNGELDVDKIMAKTRRKRCAVFTMEQTEIIAPEGAHQLDQFKDMPCKTMDFSSGIADHKKYIMYTSWNNEMVKVILEPNERMLNDMWNASPRKVIK
ncbi:MAG: hypothetical protein J6J86_03740 [Lachnospiraceae bacterium]|nr:hypothetical protein [Lachnospiraceae bacterium]